MPTNSAPRATARRTIEKSCPRGGFVWTNVALSLSIHSSSPASILPSSCRVERSDVLDVELYVLNVTT